MASEARCEVRVRPATPAKVPRRVFERATTIDEAVDETAVWAASLPGDFVVDVTDHPTTTVIRVTGQLISSGLDVSMTLNLNDDVALPEYRVDVRDSGALV